MHRPCFSCAALAFVAAMLAPRSQAGGASENALLVVDPTSDVSLQVANRYRAARRIPDRNVVYWSANPGSYASFPSTLRPAFLGALANQAIGDHVDFVVLAPGVGFQMSAPGLVTDACFPVNRFAVTTPYTLAQAYASIPAGIGSSLANGYASASDVARAFDAQTRWSGGSPVTSGGVRYFIGASLGYEGALGNTPAEILAMIDRSVAADGTFPSGTFYFCQTTDIARSGPRHGLYPAASAFLNGIGRPAFHLFGDLPSGGAACTGVMTGLADPLITAGNFTLAAGAFADHLTSYAATFDVGAQTKMSRWIAKGASGTSGAVEEPCNYAGKFPTARLHVFYGQGLALGEAWFRSLAFAPFQHLFTGDPLTRPFAHLPVPSLAGVPASPASGAIALVPSATTAHPTASIAGFELFVDGVSIGSVAPGAAFALDTTSLADGWHELALQAFDDTLVRSTASFVTSIETSNFGRAASASVAPTSGDLSTRFDFAVGASGAALVELRLVQGSRVVAARADAGTLSVFGRALGADAVRVVLEAEFADGKFARSTPIELAIADTSGPVSGAAPLASSYRHRLRTDAAAVVALPATFDDALASATWTLVSAPAQSTVLGGTGPYRIVQPNAGASGTDTLVYRVATPSGTSSDATVTLVYTAPPGACPAPTNDCASNPNSTGVAASITWSGSTRYAENGLVLSAYDLPPSSFGVFFCGDLAVEVPFGNGYRCIGGPLVRLGVQQASIFGDVQRAIDVASPPFDAGPSAIAAGATKRFQFWYRNPAGGGAGFNLTNALSVTFCP